MKGSTGELEIQLGDLRAKIAAEVLALDPDQPNPARRAVSSALDPLIRSIESTATEIGVDFSQLLRNQVALAEGSAVEDWQLLLCYAVAKGLGDKTLEASAAHVGPPLGPMGFVWAWYETGAVHPRQFGTFSPDPELFLAAYSLWVRSSPKVHLDLEFFWALLSQCERIGHKAALSTLMAMLRTVSSVRKVSVAQYKRLPDFLQRELLNSRENHRWLSMPLQRKLQEDPYSFQFTQESVERRRLVDIGQKDISSGEFASDAARTFLVHEVSQPTVRKALRDGLQRNSNPRIGPQARTLLKARRTSPEAIAVLICSVPPSKGAALLAKQPPSTIRRVIECMPPQSLNRVIGWLSQVQQKRVLGKRQELRGKLLSHVLDERDEVPPFLFKDYWSQYCGSRYPSKAAAEALKSFSSLPAKSRAALVRDVHFTQWVGEARAHEGAAARMLTSTRTVLPNHTWARLGRRYISSDVRRAECMLHAGGDGLALDLVLASPVGIAMASRLVRRSDRTRELLSAWLVNRERLDMLPARFRGNLHEDRRAADFVLSHLPPTVATEIVGNWPQKVAVKLASTSAYISKLFMAQLGEEERVRLARKLRRKHRAAPRRAAAWELGALFGLSFTPLLLKWVQLLPRNSKLSELGKSYQGEYRVYKLPKQSGGTRDITAPSEPLKAFQRRVLKIALDTQRLHPAAHGFRRGVSIVTNATLHCRQKVVVNVDIKAFFPSTRYRLVRRVVDDLYGGEISILGRRFLAELLCFDGGLPTGAPTSPAISNLVLVPVDRALSTVCERKGIVYTRYADDLTFSGDGDVTSILPFVAQVLADFDLQLDERKTNIFRRGRRQMVTGLVVNEKPNMPRRLRRRLRAAVHQRTHGKEAYWHGRRVTDHQLMGYLAFLAQTQPEEASTLRAQLTSILVGAD